MGRRGRRPEPRRAFRRGNRAFYDGRLRRTICHSHFFVEKASRKMHVFAVVSLTLRPRGAYHPAAPGRFGPGAAMTLRTARGLVALAIVFASIGAGFWLHAIWTTRRGPEV